MTVTGTEQRVYGTLIGGGCIIDLHRFALVSGSTTQSPTEASTVTYADTTPYKQCGYKYSGYITLFLSISGTSVYAAVEVRICKNDPKRIVIETYGEVAKTVIGGMSLWFNKGSETSPDWVKLNSTTSGVIMPYATTSYTFKESKRNGSTTIDCCKTCPECKCKTCSSTFYVKYYYLGGSQTRVNVSSTLNYGLNHYSDYTQLFSIASPSNGSILSSCPYSITTNKKQLYCDVYYVDPELGEDVIIASYNWINASSTYDIYIEYKYTYSSIKIWTYLDDDILEEYTDTTLHITRGTEERYYPVELYDTDTGIISIGSSIPSYLYNTSYYNGAQSFIIQIDISRWNRNNYSEQKFDYTHTQHYIRDRIEARYTGKLIIFVNSPSGYYAYDVTVPELGIDWIGNGSNNNFEYEFDVRTYIACPTTDYAIVEMISRNYRLIARKEGALSTGAPSGSYARLEATFAGYYDRCTGECLGLGPVNTVGFNPIGTGTDPYIIFDQPYESKSVTSISRNFNYIKHCKLPDLPLNIAIYISNIDARELLSPLPESILDERIQPMGYYPGTSPIKYTYDRHSNGCDVSWLGLWGYSSLTYHRAFLYIGYKANTDGTITIITDMQTDDEAIELYDEYPAIIDPIIYIFFSNFTGEEVYNHLINYGSSSGFSSTILTKKEYITTL